MGRVASLVATAALSLMALGAGAAESPYRPGRGPFPVRIDDSVSLDVRPDGPAMAVRVVYPDGPGPWPVIIFSHGMFASNQKYMPLLEQWAARGYAVVAPNHRDANGGFAPRGNEDVEQLAVTRVLDLTLLMDAVPDLEKAIPALRGKLRPPPYVGAGHSMGTYTAMLEAGLRLRNPQNGAVTQHMDPRIGAVVMSSDPGKMALMPGDLWQGVDVPTFMATGTEDYGVAGKGRKATDYTADFLSGAAAA
ncbi:MAG: alpha/beta fold hydrolase, partial [Gammaproteobacteria bacterium]